jgi:hypothetical protein
MSTTINLVKGDIKPDLTLTLTGLETSDYDTIQLLIKLNNSNHITKDGTFTTGTDVVFEWTEGDLDVIGCHAAEVVITKDDLPFRLPQSEPIILNIRENLGTPEAPA